MNLSGLGGNIALRLVMPAFICGCALAAPPPLPQQVSIHPQGASVPENLLHIELRFSRAVPQNFGVGQVQFLDEKGNPIPNVLLDLILPNSNGTRLTLLLDPGRVKSDVGPNRLSGRALQPGSRVSLIVDHASLARPARKTWIVTPFDSQPIQPGRWWFRLPRAGTFDPLVVHLDKPIASAGERLIVVRDPAGEGLAGTARLENGDASWRFVPASRWRTGQHAVVAHPELEDPAGNRACAAFEQIKASDLACESGAVLPFVIRAKAVRAD